MGMHVPADHMANAVALATAARSIDDAGGGAKLSELMQAIPSDDIAVVAIILARIVGTHFGDEWLEATGMLCATSGAICL